MRTAHVGALRIYEFHGSSSKRASNQEVVIVYSSWPCQILFSRWITFLFFFFRLRLDSFRLNPTLPLFSLPPLYHLPSSAAPSHPSLCQQLEDFFDKSSAHTSIHPPLACVSLAIRFEEIDSSPVYDVLSNRVNTERRSSSLKLGVSPLHGRRRLLPLLLSARDLPG